MDSTNLEMIMGYYSAIEITESNTGVCVRVWIEGSVQKQMFVPTLRDARRLVKELDYFGISNVVESDPNAPVDPD